MHHAYELQNDPVPSDSQMLLLVYFLKLCGLGCFQRFGCLCPKKHFADVGNMPFIEFGDRPFIEFH
jgi:hypothetical protein